MHDLIYFSYLITLAKTSLQFWIQEVTVNEFVLFLILKWKALIYSLLTIMPFVGGGGGCYVLCFVFVHALYNTEEVPF